MGFCKRKNIECDCLTDHSVCNTDNCHKGLPDTMVKTAKIAQPQVEMGVFETNNPIYGFAVGTKCKNKGFVLNMSDGSCILLTGVGQVDMRKFNFNEFDFVELNGNKFVREK